MGGCCSFCSVSAKQGQKQFAQSPATTRRTQTGSDRALPQSKPLASPSPLPSGRNDEVSVQGRSAAAAALVERGPHSVTEPPLLAQTSSQLPANTVSTLGTTLTLNLTLSTAPQAMKMPTTTTAMTVKAIDGIGSRANGGDSAAGPAAVPVPPARRRLPHRGSCASNVTVEDLITDTLQVSASTVTEPHETVESDDITATSYVDVSQPTQSLLVDRALHTHEAPMRTLSDMDATSDFDYTLPETYDPSRTGYARRERERHVASHETESRARIARLMYLTWRALLARFYRELFTIERLDMLQHFFLERCALLLRITAVDEKRRRGWIEKEAAAQRAAVVARLSAGRDAIAQATASRHAHRHQPRSSTASAATAALRRNTSEPVEEDDEEEEEVNTVGPHFTHRHPNNKNNSTRVSAVTSDSDGEDNNYVDLDGDEEEEGEVGAAIAVGDEVHTEDIFSPRSPSAQMLPSRTNSPGRPSTAPAGPSPSCLTEGSSASNDPNIPSPRNRNTLRERSSSHMMLRTSVGYVAKMSSRDSSSLLTSHDTPRPGHEMDTSC